MKGFRSKLGNWFREKELRRYSGCKKEPVWTINPLPLVVLGVLVAVAIFAILWSISQTGD
jgi:hypothetical protein